MEKSIPLYLAPMAELSHAGLRTLIQEFGCCDRYFSEMLSVNALVSGSKFEKYYLQTEPDPSKLIIQLVGSDPSVIVKAAAIINDLDIAGVDINMGCSAPDIARFGSGISWMKDIEKARSLISALRNTVKTPKTLSVKIRIGYEENTEYLLSFAKTLAREGLDFITLHPRLKNEKLKRRSRWSYVTMLKNELAIPVIGNGDINDWSDYNYACDHFSFDGIMIGRAAARAPWIFSYLKKRAAGITVPTPIDLYKTALRFNELLEQYQPIEFHLSRAQRFYLYFSENLFYGHAFITRIQNAPDFTTVRYEVDAFFDRHPEAVLFFEKE